MNIIFYILCVIVGFFVTYILGMQFYKLGQSLKSRFPIIYRIYTIFWGFMGAFVLIGVLVGVKSYVDNYQEAKKIEKIESTFKKYANGVDYTGIVDEARLLGYSDKEIYAAARDGEKLKKVFDELAKEGVTDQEIGKFLNLNPYNNYVSEAQKASNEAMIAADQAEAAYNDLVQMDIKENELTVEQMVQMVEQSKNQSSYTPKTQKHYSHDIFIAPDLQEKAGTVDTYHLKSMISDAKNAQKQDKDIFAMLKETVQYGVIIKEYEENGLSDKSIAEKFGLSI